MGALPGVKACVLASRLSMELPAAGMCRLALGWPGTARTENHTQAGTYQHQKARVVTNKNDNTIKRK